MMAKKFLKISDLPERTGKSLRYWQQRAKDGQIPGCMMMRHGKRIIYHVPAAGFDAWWESQMEAVPCEQTPKTSFSAKASGGLTSALKRSAIGSHSKRDLLKKLKAGATA